MSYKSRKSIVGDDNQQNETLSHNKIHFSDSGSLQIVTIFLCVLIVGSIVFMAVLHTALFSTLIVASFIGFFGLLWILALSFTVRHVSGTHASVSIDRSQRSRAQLEADVIHATDHYILWRDPDGSYQFRGSTIVTENRQFLPQLPAPKDPSQGILECWDQGMSARGIEKHMKEAGVTYYQITKVLDSFRKGWNKKTVAGDIVSEQEDV